MSRHTPTIVLNESEVKSLQEIMLNNSENSINHKRAGVLLACAEGKQGKEIASHYHLNPNTVIEWRRKYENCGVEGLMSDAPKPGKSIADDPTVIEKVKDALTNKLPNYKPWTLRGLAKHVRIPRTSLQKILNRLGISLSEFSTSEPIITLPDLKDKKIEVLGLFLTMTVQILAFVIYSSTDIPLFPGKKFITITNNSTKSQQETTGDDLDIDLYYTLKCINKLTSRENDDKLSGEIISFVQSLQSSLNGTGKQLYLVINGPELSSIVHDQSIEGTNVSSIEEFKTAASLWFDAMNGSNRVSRQISQHINRLLDDAPNYCEPFIWQLSQEVCQPSEQTPPVDGNSLMVTLSYKDNLGKSIVCTKEISNAVPNCQEFGKCKTIYEFQNLAGKLEQGIVTTVQDVEKELFQQSISVGSAQSPSEDLKKRPSSNRC